MKSLGKYLIIVLLLLSCIVTVSASDITITNFTTGSYVGEKFTGAGTITFTFPAGVTNVEYLLIGGGAGGGYSRGGGGGAGGFRNGTKTLSGSTVTIDVGIGGTSGIAANESGRGGQGANSTFDGLVSDGGGWGGSANSGNSIGGHGASGGGSVDGADAGTGTAGQGLAGGIGNALANFGAGGGGGNQTVGVAGTGTNGGNGGNGGQSAITGTMTYYSGGGGGGIYLAGVPGTGGSGGGGNGGLTIDGLPGTDILGGGGGGGGYSGSAKNGGRGGNGTVIVRWIASDAPVANFTAAPTDMMYGATLQLNDTSTNSPTMFNYSFLDGAGTKTWSNGTTLAYQNLTRIMNSGGHYTIQLWAQNAGGGNYSDKQMVIDVRNWSPATMSGTPQSGANPLTVTFTGSSNNATQYYWEFGDTATSAIQNPTHQYTADGVYTVNYGTTNSHHAFNWSNNSGYITVNVTLLADFSGTPTSGILNPTLPVNFVDMSTGDGLYAWTWDFGDTGSSTLRNPSHSYTTPGSYNVKLTTSGSDGTTSKTKNGYITAISNSTAAGGSLNFTPIISSQGGGTIVYQNKTFNLYDQNFTPWPIYLFVAVIGLFFLTVSFIVRRNAEIFAALAIIPLAFTAWSSLAIDMSQSFGMSGMLYNQTASGNMWMLLENHTVYPSVVLAIIFLILSLVAFVQFINELLQGRIIEDKEPEE